MPTYSRRIATRITPDADNRLRLAAVVLRMPLSALLTLAIDKQLPPASELAASLRDDADEAVAS